MEFQMTSVNLQIMEPITTDFPKLTLVEQHCLSYLFVLQICFYMKAILSNPWGPAWPL